MTKICTSIEQSKKLLELGIDVNTADMFYRDNGIDVKLMWEHNAPKVESPCWSLSALLDIVPSKTGTASILIRDSRTGKYKCVHGSIFSNSYEESVDAVFEMICHLKENGKI